MVGLLLLSTIVLAFLKQDPLRLSDRVECYSQLLLSPTFVVHLSWMVGQLLLSTIALADLFLKLVFVGYTLGVAYSSPRISSRYIYVFVKHMQVQNKPRL